MPVWQDVPLQQPTQLSALQAQAPLTQVWPLSQQTSPHGGSLLLSQTHRPSWQVPPTQQVSPHGVPGQQPPVVQPGPPVQQVLSAGQQKPSPQT